MIPSKIHIPTWCTPGNDLGHCIDHQLVTCRCRRCKRYKNEQFDLKQGLDCQSCKRKGHIGPLTSTAAESKRV